MKGWNINEVRVTVTNTQGAVASDVLKMDPYANGNISVATSGSVAGSYSLQYTLDDLDASASVTPTWINHVSIVGKVSIDVAAFTVPITGLRLLTSASTSGVIALKVLQKANH